MRSFPILEFLLISSLAVALIVKPMPHEVTAMPAAVPATRIVHAAPTTQPSSPQSQSASADMDGGR